jgi:hypothetical protein
MRSGFSVERNAELGKFIQPLDVLFDCTFTVYEGCGDN